MQLQVALDLLDLDQAVAVTGAVIGTTHRIEVGTPLLRMHGTDAIVELRRSFPEAVLVADHKTMDCGAIEARLSIEAGANGLIVEAAAPRATLLAACTEARASAGFVMADGLGFTDMHRLARTVRDLPVAHVVVHAGVDQQRLGGLVFDDLMRFARRDQPLPIAAAGGISSQNCSGLLDVMGLDVVIVGQAICASTDPRAEAIALCEVLSIPSPRGE